MPAAVKTHSHATRFPPSGRAEKTPSGYKIKAANGKDLVFIYEEDESIRRNMANLILSSEGLRLAEAVET